MTHLGSQRRSRLRLFGLCDGVERVQPLRDEATEAMWQYQLVCNELLSAKIEGTTYGEQAQADIKQFDTEWVAAGLQDEDVPLEFRRAVKAMARFESAEGVADSLRVEAREEALHDAVEVKAALLGLHEGNSILERLEPTMREALRGNYASRPRWSFPRPLM